MSYTGSLETRLRNHSFEATQFDAVKGDKKQRFVRLDFAIAALQELGEHTVSWSVDDFEWQAESLVGDGWENIYDRKKFPDALREMIRKHDASLGISWETISCYLDENCKKDENEEEN